MNHRGIQGTLFRMQLDPGFGIALRSGDVDAVRSTGLEPADLEYLVKADPAQVSADRDGARRAQFLRNVGAEFALWCAVVSRREDPLEAFTASAEFHDAVRERRSLPLAFADYAERRSAESDDRVQRTLLRLEVALARARRCKSMVPDLAPDAIVLAPWASLMEFPAGTLACVDRVRAALDVGEAPSRKLRLKKGESEVLLVSTPPDSNPFRLPGSHVERLEPTVASFLASAREPLDERARAEFARECDAEPADVEALVDGLVVDRVLVHGRGASS